MAERTRGWRWVNIRRRILKRDPICVKCRDKGKVSVATEVDHIIPISKEGTDADSNLQGLCAECHKKKTAQDFGYTRQAGSDLSGMPLDPSHPWYKGE